jgi:hypothetical protein
VKKKTGPATVEVGSIEALESAQADNKVFVLGYFAQLEGDDHAAYEAGALTGSLPACLPACLPAWLGGVAGVAVAQVVWLVLLLVGCCC